MVELTVQVFAFSASGSRWIQQYDTERRFTWSNYCTIIEPIIVYELKYELYPSAVVGHRR
jgi:hypothetical protein